MPETQKVKTPLVERDIKVEPSTPPDMPLLPRIQRAWSLLFGKRQNTLQPIYADRAGQLGVVNLDLNGWNKVYNSDTSGGWVDMGFMVDLVIYSGTDATSTAPWLYLGWTTGDTRYVVVPQAVSMIYYDESFWKMCTGWACCRCRWYFGTAIFGGGGRIVGYTAPDR